MSAKLPTERLEMATTPRPLCGPDDTRTALLSAWRKKDLEAFKEVLAREDCDPNYLYDNEMYMRLLDKAAAEGNVKFAAALLDAKAEVNQRNPAKSKAPLHFAAEAGQLGMLQLLLDSGGDVNIQDVTGSTALHYLARKKWAPGEVLYLNCLEHLLGRPGVQLNIVNRKGFTPVHLAASEGALEALKTLLEKGSELDLDSTRSYKDRTAREEILARYPELRADLPPPLAPHQVKMDATKLFLLLNSCDNKEDKDKENIEERFINKFEQEMQDKAQKNLLVATDGDHTFLQRACEHGLARVVKCLLDQGADVNLHEEGTMSPLGVACYWGHLDVVPELLRHGAAVVPTRRGEDSVLHVLAKKTAGSPQHQKCLERVLRHCTEKKVDVNVLDMKLSTPLHYAVKYGTEESVFQLLEHGAYIGQSNLFKDSPLAKMSAATLERYLDSTITIPANGRSQRDEDYAWEVDYRFLRPPVAAPPRPSAGEVKVAMGEEEEAAQPLAGEAVTSRAPESDPLVYMSISPDLRRLLTHPVLRSFIVLKWQRVQNFYFINLMFYFIFCALLTIYILFGYRTVAPRVLEVSPPKMKVAHDKLVGEVASSGNLTDWGSTAAPAPSAAPVDIDGSLVVELVRAVLVLFLLLIIGREVFQLWINPRRYMTNAENWLEVLLIVVSTFVVVKDCSREWPHSARLAAWCPQFCAIAILVSWFELVLLVGKHPLLSLNIEMFKTVSMTFLKFLAWYAILIVAFALSFYTLFRGCSGECSESNPFTDPSLSIFKTVVMLTGEFEAGDIPFLTFLGTSHLIFIAFVFLIAIVLLNLLNGLAVTDTQAIREDAFLYSTIAQVKVIAHIESLFLGDSSPLRLRLRAIRSLLCCCRGVDSEDIVCYKYFSNRILLFPSLIRDGSVSVYPNQGNKIYFEKKDVSEAGDTCLSGKNFYVEKSSASRMEQILDGRQTEEASAREDTGLKEEVEECKKKLQKLETKLDGLAGASQECQTLLLQMLAIVSLNNANNDDR